MQLRFLLLLSSLFFINTVLAQVTRGKEWDAGKKYYEKVMQADKDFNSIEVPAAYTKEPVVILCQKFYFSFLKGKLLSNMVAAGSGVKGIIRKKVKIQDQSAIEDFSEFYFQSSEVMGITLIKADGAATVIETKDAIKVETEVPSFYRSGFQNSAYYKIAIPNLEVGDIIDFYTVYQEAREESISIMTTLPETYPIVQQSFIIDIGKGWNFYYRSLNGAPEFVKQQETGRDNSGLKDKKTLRYVLNDTNQSSHKYERWDYGLLTEPTIKFIAFRSPAEFMTGDATIKNVKIDKFRPLLGREVNSMVLQMPGVRTAEAKQEWKYLSEKELPEIIYKQLRYQILGTDDRDIESLEETYNLDLYGSMKSSYFISIFKHFLDKYKVPNELIYAVPKAYGAIDVALTEYEAELGIHVTSIDQYYFAPDNYTKPGEIWAYLDQAAILKLQLNRSSKYGTALKTARTGFLPKQTPKDNLQETFLEMTFSEDLNEQEVSAKIDFHNVYRHRHARLFLFNTDYRAADRELYNLSKSKKMYYMSKKIAREAAKTAAKKTVDKKTEKESIKIKAIERFFKEDYSIKKLNSYEVLNDGRNGPDPLQVVMDFTSEDLVQKAGKNYIFSLGSFIGEQVALEKEEIQERTKDIQFGYAKLINNTIKVTIPEGYTIDGLDALKFNIDNDYMAFITTTTLTGNELTLTTSKNYKQAFVPQKDWDKVVAALEAAYKFTQTKVVLKKIK